MQDDRDRRTTDAGDEVLASGTPRPNTERNSATSGGPIPDPDYGMDPNDVRPSFGSTGRGRDRLAGTTGARRAPLEGEGATAQTGRGTERSGIARGGDTTSEADTYEDARHGTDEGGVRANMDQGVNTPPVGSGDTGSMRRTDVDPSHEATFEEGQQYAESDRS